MWLIHWCLPLECYLGLLSTKVSLTNESPMSRANGGPTCTDAWWGPCEEHLHGKPSATFPIVL